MIAAQVRSCFISSLVARRLGHGISVIRKLFLRTKSGKTWEVLSTKVGSLQCGAGICGCSKNVSSSVRRAGRPSLSRPDSGAAQGYFFSSSLGGPPKVDWRTLTDSPRRLAPFPDGRSICNHRMRLEPNPGAASTSFPFQAWTIHRLSNHLRCRDVTEKRLGDPVGCHQLVPGMTTRECESAERICGINRDCGFEFDPGTGR